MSCRCTPLIAMAPRFVAVQYSDGRYWYGAVVDDETCCSLSGKTILDLMVCSQLACTHSTVRVRLTAEEYRVYEEQALECTVLDHGTNEATLRKPVTPRQATEYCWRFKMSDPQKRCINAMFVNFVACSSLPAKRALVLDAENMFTSSSLLRACPFLERVDVPVTVDPTFFKVPDARIRLHRADAADFLAGSTHEYDCVFLDHCATIKSEKASLANAVAKVRRGGVLACTYCLRGAGMKRTQATLAALLGKRRHRGLAFEKYGSMLFIAYVML